MTTNRIHLETGAPINESTLELQDRIRRANAPTLRDLQAAMTDAQKYQLHILAADPATEQSLIDESRRGNHDTQHRQPTSHFPA
ncbi:MAG: hypothetical protein AB7P14_15310 [Blastocatellales bacterium]